MRDKIRFGTTSSNLNTFEQHVQCCFKPYAHYCRPRVYRESAWFIKMTSRLKSRIHTLFTTVIRSLRMSFSLQTAYKELRSGATSDVATYLGSLKLGFLEDSSRRLDDTLVTELYLVKQRSSAQHEYLVARIRAPDGTERYLAVERLRGPQRVDPDLASRSDSSVALARSANTSAVDLQNNEPSHPSRTTSLASLDSLKKQHNADDVVRVLDKPLHDTSDITLGKLVFKDRPLYLYQLVILAVVLHESDKGYKVITRNCYWFAGLLIAILEANYGLKMKRLRGDGSEGEETREGEGEGEEAGQGLQGTWNYITIYRTPTRTPPPSDIVKAYEEGVEAFEANVSSGRARLTSTEHYC
jgi:hypothetical protein